MLWTILLGLPGGLALFILGMQKMSEGLQKVAGDRLRRVLEVLTTNRFMGIITGAVVTVLVQSSSTVTVMVVGFVNAGLLTLFQAVAIILGANVGTTVTAQLVSFRIEEIALPAIAVGFLIHFLFEKKFYRYIGQSIMGFGILFLGMRIMSETLYPLRDSSFFVELITSFGQLPLLGILMGALFTILVQSSSAASGVIIALTVQGLMDISSGLALVLGTNIGTCVTAFLASLGANLTARRTAMAHIFFNVIGSLLFYLFLGPFTSLVLLTSAEIPRQVANGHTIFNIANTLLFLPFIGLFTRFIEKILPGSEEIPSRGPRYLDERMLSTPAVALDIATRETLRMIEISLLMVEDIEEIFSKIKRQLARDIEEKEETINQLELDITTFLSRLSLHSLTEDQSKRVARLMHTINDVERIGDHAINILELLQQKEDKGLSFSPQATEELQKMGAEVQGFLRKTLSSFKEEDIKWALMASKADDRIDSMEKNLRTAHMTRLNQEICSPIPGVLFLDILSNLERIGDHTTNIAQSVLYHH